MINAQLLPGSRVPLSSIQAEFVTVLPKWVCAEFAQYMPGIECKIAIVQSKTLYQGPPAKNLDVELGRDAHYFLPAYPSRFRRFPIPLLWHFGEAPVV